MVSNVMYHHAVSAPKAPPSPSSVIADATRTPITASTKTSSSVVFQDGLVSSASLYVRRALRSRLVRPVDVVVVISASKSKKVANSAEEVFPSHNQSKRNESISTHAG